MTQERKFRVAVVNSHPIQYFAPLYAYLCTDPAIEITALYCSDFSLRGGMDPGFRQRVTWNVDLLHGYRVIFLGARAKKRSPRGFFTLICPEVWRAVRKGGYDAIWLHGYNYAAYVVAFLAAKSCGIPVFMRSETHLGLQRTGWRQHVRDGLLRFAYRFVDGFLAIGSANRIYYRALGVPEKEIFDVPYTVDNARFIAAARLSERECIEVRRKYSLRPYLPIVLYASKLMPRKHPDDLIEAIAKLRDEGMPVTLFMVGTGDMEPALRARVDKLGLHDVVFGGFVNQAELPQVYAASDAFVLPSKNEPWGLAVNEAMCAGIPVIVADEVGCVPDLVKDGVNGAHMRAGDVGSLVAALKCVLADQEQCRRMGRKSLESLQRWSYEQCRQGLLSAISAVQARGA